jgi:hypothetical protein
MVHVVRTALHLRGTQVGYHGNWQRMRSERIDTERSVIDVFPLRHARSRCDWRPKGALALLEIPILGDGRRDRESLWDQLGCGACGDPEVDQGPGHGTGVSGSEAGAVYDEATVSV